MRERPTRLLAIVAFLLGIIALGFHQNAAVTAQQRLKTYQSYLPILPVRPPAAVGDLRLVHLGLFQSVQNNNNDVTLVARKPGILRIYAESSRPGMRAEVTVEAYRDGALLGALTTDSQVIPTSATAADIASTINVDLPIEWLEGRVTLRATIDNADAIAESHEGNNVIQAKFTFRHVPGLNLTIVPIRYVDVATGVTYSKPGYDPISGWLLAAYPISEIDVTIREPYTFTGNLRQGGEWNRLLQEITGLWAAEVGPGSADIYYGLVPNSTPGGGSWFTGGVTGLGWIGQRVSIGLDTGEGTGVTAGHEIGHNFGRSHAPCGNPSGPDPRYPYPNATIGVFGIDTADDQLMDPHSHHDVMSYCGPEWVSDYTYEGLLHDQTLRADRSATAAADGLFITASLDEDKATFAPIRAIRQPFHERDRRAAVEYEVQLLDATGEVIATYPADLYEAEEVGAKASMLVGHVPAPADGVTVSAVRFLRGDAVIAEQTLVAGNSSAD